MGAKRSFWSRLPGYSGAGLMVLLTMLWTYWSMGEMYHEGWWGAWYNRLPYLIPGTVCLIMTLLALTWPRLGGWTMVIIGIAFSIFFMDFEIVDGRLNFNREIGGFLVSGSLVLIGVLFLIEGRLKRRFGAGERQAQLPWVRRNLRYLLAVGLPGLIVVGFSVAMLPVVLTRVDDGERGARLIEGNGVTLIWAPEGPGWNWKQDWGGYPSWNDVALFGLPPVGLVYKPGYGRLNETLYLYGDGEQMAQYNLCRYLSEDGLSLEGQRVDIWRMPTTDEVVRSLVRDGKNAGCEWHGEFAQRVSCVVQPDKESPLWATDVPVIYYWTADEYDEDEGYFVSYNGFVNAARKSGGNPRHSYRCVRSP